MNVRKPFLAVLAAGAATLTLSSFALAAPAATYRESREDTRQTVQRAYRLDLTRSQREKISWLNDRYQDRIRDLRRNNRLSPRERDERIWEQERELRERVMLVLTPAQRRYVEAQERREDRRDDRRDNRRDGRNDRARWR